jgi:WD40 repeat protein
MLAAPVGHKGVMLWTALTNGAKAEMFKVPAERVIHLVFAPDGKPLYAGCDQICAFDLARRKGTRLKIPAWSPLRFGVSRDGSRLVVAEQPRMTHEQCRVTVWATDALGKPLAETTSPSFVRMPPLFPPTGDHCILVEDNRQPSRQWEFRRVLRSIHTGEILERSEPLADAPDEIALSLDGRKLACRTREVIRIYPAGGTWKDVPTITNDSKKHFTGIAFHPSGKYLAATSNDETVKLYDTATWEVARTFTWDIGRMRSIAFSPDGNLAAAGSDKGKVVVWDVDL